MNSQPPKKEPTRWSEPRVIVAAVALIAGGVVLVRGLWWAIPVRVQDAETRAESRMDPPPSAPGEAEQQPWEYQSVELEVSDPFDQPNFRHLLETAVRAAAAEAGAATDAPAIAAEASAYFTEVVGGTADSYNAFVAARGGSTGLTSDDDQQRAESRRRIEDVLAAFHGQPLSLRLIQVRRRVQNQVTVPVSEWGGRTKLTTAPGQYPALAGAVENTEYGTIIRGETFEVLVPIGHQYEGRAEATVVIGLWISKSQVDGRWRPSAVATYGPKSLVPTISPPL